MIERFNPRKGREMHRKCCHLIRFWFSFNPRKGREMHQNTNKSVNTAAQGQFQSP